jgi:hypothetical protein
MKFLKMRGNVIDDPRYDYMVGRLVGAAELMSLYMTLHGDEKARGMAARVYETLEFFFDPEEHAALPVPPDQEITKVIP